MSVQLVFDLLVIAALAWFWIRRAHPTLTALGARPRAIQLGLIATVVAIATLTLHVVTLVTGTGEVVANVLRLAAGFAWIVVVGLGHPEYRFLRHATGTKPPGR